MRSLSLMAALALLGLAACSSDDALETSAAPASAAKDPATTIADTDAAALRDQIYPNWYVTPGSGCHEPLKVRIDLAADGTVIRAEPRPERGDDDPCRPAADAAIRAIWAASPLKVPRTRKWSSLTLVFDLNALL